MVADGQDSGFQQDAQSVGKNFSVIPEYFFPVPGSPNLSDELVNMWGKAYDYIFYFGHGSIQQWGKDRIFSSEDITSLPDQKLSPIVIQFTCLTGFFSHPERNSLSEDLILNPKGGAIGMLAPTSLTLPQDQNFLAITLAKEINKEESSRLGDLLVNTWQQYLAKTNSSVEVYQTFLRLQLLFERQGVRPTYLLSPEVLRDDDCAALFRGLEGRAELGTHLHAEFIEPRASMGAERTDAFQGELPPFVEYEKLLNLTALFCKRFGRAPTSFRAGRYGLGRRTLRFLEQLGYVVESSVTPHASRSPCIMSARPTMDSAPGGSATRPSHAPTASTSYACRKGWRDHSAKERVRS